MKVYSLENLIDQHLEAYNAHDITRFSHFFAKEIEFKRDETPPQKISHGELMRIYNKLFKSSPNVQARVISRKVDVNNNTVNDIEEVNFGRERGIEKFDVLYKIDNFLIISISLKSIK